MSKDLRQKIKDAIQQRINAFATGRFADNAIALFKELGYESNKRITLDKGAFEGLFAEHHTVDAQKALIGDWKSADYLFQLTEEEISHQKSLFSVNQYNPNEYQSYSFVAIELKNEHYARGRLSQITREVNKLFPMPVMILFKHGNTLTLSIINRRLHKRDESKDVLEKVTLIKDIKIPSQILITNTNQIPLNKGGKGVVTRGAGDVTHRAHIEILFDLSFDELKNKHGFTNFVELHDAWQKTLDTSELNKRFFKELANWYFWAMDNVEFPDDLEKKKDVRNATNLIRLITRLVFIWFIKEKDLLPDLLFNKNLLNTILNDFNKNNTSNVYYHAILQNLFFGTLNQKMGERGFAKEGSHYDRMEDYGVKNLFRYPDKFAIKEKEVIELFKDIPFLNGGLFDCLDKPDEKNVIQYVDGFSRKQSKQAKVPDFLFFTEKELEVDLTAYYDPKARRPIIKKVKGLIEILDSYKFTVTENTPIEEEIALDPELLGKVFENLLASYNPETQTTARKQTGSFYTPREIVNYMVDESLIAYLATQLNHPPLHPLPLRAGNVSVPSPLAGEGKGEGDVCHSSESRNPEDSNVTIANETKQSKSRDEIASDPANPRNGTDIHLRHLLSYTDEPHKFSRQDVDILIDAIDNIKVLDPACGSGAFPMGILHKLVHLLHKLDPVNEQWKKRQIEKAKLIDDPHIRQNAIDDIEAAFATNELDYGRKLYLIENCIYGVDIQPIAVQIAKLRFFISLIIDEKKQPGKENLGIRSLPNLETKFVAANTLSALDKPQGQLSFRNLEIERLEKELKELRHEYFNAKTRKEKLQCQKQDKELRQDIAGLLVNDGWNNTTARQIAAFDLYDQNASSPFFDPEWMFGLKEGFDIVIGNPPYIRQEDLKPIKPVIEKQGYAIYNSTSDIYTYFYEKGWQVLNESGHLIFITSNKWMRAKYGEKLRKFFKEKTRLKKITDFGGHKVFESATVDTNILIFQKKADASHCRENGNLEVLSVKSDFSNGIDITEYFRQNAIAMSQTDLDDKCFTFGDDAVINLKAKIERIGVPLKDWDVKIYRGVITGFNEAFIIDNETKERLCKEDTKSIDVLKPILRGRDIQRYSYKWAGLWLIKIESGWTDKNRGKKDPERFFKEAYPAIYDHLKTMGEKKGKGKGLYLRDDQGDYWWELRDCDYYEEFEKKKLIYRDVGSDLSFAYEEGDIYGNNTVYFINTGNKFLLAVLNSALLSFYYTKISSQLGDAASRAFTIFIEQLPIPQIPEKAQQPFITLVDQILSAKKKDPRTDTSALEKQIDVMVYKLYGLTYEEVKIIEPEFAMSEVEYEAFEVK